MNGLKMMKNHPMKQKKKKLQRNVGMTKKKRNHYNKKPIIKALIFLNNIAING